ncbi:MAG: aminotransferase class III-fold pyridoxal phosphate-dependent enzyme [Caldisericia bacterium]|nr:aminotransferase class III-fold pyridoxal phosphate-dependent enzyme [Caldisericia bacterium]
MNISIYNSFPIHVKKAMGCIVESTEGISYVDTFSGIGVMLLGHSYEPVLESIRNRIQDYMHLSNYFPVEDATSVENILLSATEMKQGGLFYTNSGTEATEAALRIVKKRETCSKKTIIHFSGSFHGRTLGSLSLLRDGPVKKRFGSLLPNIQSLEWNNEEAFDKYMNANGQEVLAIFVETIQGSGGIRIISDSMAEKLKHYQKQYNILLVCDEIQSGLGRTGKWFAFQHWGLQPDIVLVGKGLGGGLPLGTTIFSEELRYEFLPGDHGSTFAPNPVALAAAKTVLSEIPSCISYIQKMTPWVQEFICTMLGNCIKDFRQKGFMIGIDPIQSAKEMVQIGREYHHVLLNVTYNGTIRLLPPLNTTKEDWSLMITPLQKTLQQCII